MLPLSLGRVYDVRTLTNVWSPPRVRRAFAGRDERPGSSAMRMNAWWGMAKEDGFSHPLRNRALGSDDTFRGRRCLEKEEIKRFGMAILP